MQLISNVYNKDIAKRTSFFISLLWPETISFASIAIANDGYDSNLGYGVSDLTIIMKIF